MKTIFITGAASGIGKATACLFLEKGWFVGLYDRDEKALADLAVQMNSKNLCYHAMDVTETQQVKDAVQHFSSFSDGKMDLLFNNAGILHMGFFEEIDLEKQIDTVQVNLTGVINCIHGALPLLRQTPDARIVNMSSASAVYGTPELAAYSATKCAIRGLTEALNLSFERLGIHVCDIMVPYVQTPLLDKPRQALSIQKLGVKLQPEDVAEFIWKASRGRKVHWAMGIKHLLFVTWLLPFTKKWIIRYYTGTGSRSTQATS